MDIVTAQQRSLVLELDSIAEDDTSRSKDQQNLFSKRLVILCWCYLVPGIKVEIVINY